MWLLILTVERQKAASPPCVLSSDRGQRLSVSCGAGADKPTAKLLTSLYSKRLLVLVLSRFHSVFLLSSFHTVISFSVSMKRTGLLPRYSVRFPFNSVDILESQTKKERFQGEKKEGIFLLSFRSLRHTPMFSFAAQGGESELARQTAGVVSCNWNWCKGPGVVLPSLPANSSSQHGCTFSRPQSTEETTACQSVAAPRGSPPPPPPASNIYQSRQNPFEFRSVLRV